MALVTHRLVRLLAIAAIFGLIGVAGSVYAAKPEVVAAWSNGFPSGEHYNLNIHGKKDGYACDSTPGGGSVFVPEYGASDIHYVMNKKSVVESLEVRDPCAGFDGDEALVQLPAGEYQVYARILAKPAKDGEPRSVVFYPGLVQTCDDSGTENFTDAVDCEESFLVGSGVVTSGGAFDLDSQSLERLAPTGKGKNRAVDISPLFQWSGWACNQTFDANGDGQITLDDVPADLTGDGVIDQDDLDAYLGDNCTFLESTWVFDIADLVVYGWDYQNNGSKLVQVRFYPLDTTDFA